MAEITAMTLKEAKDFAERLADLGSNMEMMSRRWDAYRYLPPAAIATFDLLKPEPAAGMVVFAQSSVQKLTVRALAPGRHI